MSDFVVKQIETLLHLVEPLLSSDKRDLVLEPELAKLAAPLMAKRDVPATALLRLCLLNDCLRIAERLVCADGQISKSELDYLYPLLRHLTPFLVRLRASYVEYERLAPVQSRDLLLQHQADGQPFGGVCKRTEWAGFGACRHLSRLSNNPALVRRYAALMGRLIDELVSLGSQTPAEDEAADKLRRIVRDRTQIDDEDVAEASEQRLVEAFCEKGSSKVFRAVAHAHEVWQRDPFDVEAVHAEARQSFDFALDLAQDANAIAGRSLILLGESGAGKTHLLRAFRAMGHGSFRAFTGYIQLNVGAKDYKRLFVQRLVDSMDRPYDPPRVTDSALTRLSDTLAARIGERDNPQLMRLREGDLSLDEIAQLTHDLANTAIHRGLSEVHVDLIRACLLLQRRDPALRQRVLKFLRLEPLSSHEQNMLGEIAPWTDDGCATRMLIHLGKLIWEASGSALVLLLDQLEDLSQQDDTTQRFRQLADAVRSITDELPHCVVVLASLQDFFLAYAGELTAAVRDRLERDPAPQRLTSSRSREEVHALLERRLTALFADYGLQIDDERPLYPFSAAQLDPLEGLRTRDVIDWCANYQRSCAVAGALVDPSQPDVSLPKVSGLAEHALQPLWQQALEGEPAFTPATDPELVTLIAWGFEHLGAELGAETTVQGAEDAGCLLELGHIGQTGAGQRTYLGLTNKMPQGGHLARQLQAMAATAKTHRAPLSLVRSGEFPDRRGTKVAELLGNLVKQGARKASLAEEEVRTLAHLRAFWNQHKKDELSSWARQCRPLSTLSLYQQLFDLNALKQQDKSVGAEAGDNAADPTMGGRGAANPGPKATVPKATVPKFTEDTAPQHTAPQHTAPEATIPVTYRAGAILLGRGLGLRRPAVDADPAALAKHVAIVGSTGSGKTTLALCILEQILAAEVPVVMVDRKGDLCSYADPEFWTRPETDPARTARKQALREKLDIRVYTPGDSRGQHLAIQLSPAGLGELPLGMRGIAATHAASALANMLGIKIQPHEQKLSILAKGIELLAESSHEVTINMLAALIRDRDPDLMNYVGGFKDNHFEVLAERLLSLEMLNRALFARDGDVLSGDLLFGRGAHDKPGKTRLTIISTKSLPNDEVVEFWVAQLLSELLAWASHAPSPKLQAMVFLDEADLYLPATSKPATKEPALDLLKRGRSAGLGLMLGTQNPGDFDYKARANINSWFLGLVSQVNDLKRMRPLLSEARTDISGKLANARPGEFYMLQAGGVTPFAATRSLMETRQLSESEILEFAKRSR